MRRNLWILNILRLLLVFAVALGVWAGAGAQQPSLL